MTIALTFDGFTFEFPNRAAMTKFAEHRKEIAEIVVEAIKRGPNKSGVCEAVFRPSIHETVTAEPKPLHELTDSEFSEHASRVFAEALTGAHAGKPSKEIEKRKAKENKEPHVKESEGDAKAPVAAPEIDVNDLFKAMSTAHGAQWGRGVGGRFSLSDFLGGYTGSDAPVIQLPGITPDGGV